MRWLPLLLALLLQLPLASPAAEKNIVFFIADDLGRDLGCYGHPSAHTPHMDALAKEGVLFRHAFATTASCSASRSVILSGLHNHLNGQYGHQHDYHHFSAFPRVAPLALPRALEVHGYRTGHIGKYHVAPESVHHFQTYLKGPPRNAVAMAEATRAFIAAPDARPFFLYFATADPHRGPEYDETTPERPNLFGNKPQGGAYPGVTERFFKPGELPVPAFLPDTATAKAELAQYQQSVARVDAGLGRLVEILKAAGVYEQTLIVVTSDHGIAMPGAKTTVYEPGLLVPFIVRNPYAGRRGAESDAYLSHVDITPSLLDFAGAYDAAQQAPSGLPTPARKKPVNAEMENPGPVITRYHGRSWLPVLAAEPTSGWDEVFASHTFHEIQMYYPMRVVRDRQYKLIWNLAHPLPFPFASDLWEAPTWQAQYRQGESAPYGVRTVGAYLHRPKFELYDMQADPDERVNLAAKPEMQPVLEKYIARLKAWEEETGDPWRLKWDYE